MRRRKQAAAMLCALAVLTASGAARLGASARVNDAKYDAYVNMDVSPTGHARYIVPNLYREDAAYKNVKLYPLVVSGGVDYVPVDIFAQFSYLTVSYSRIGYGFYISNTRNGSYIAFDLESGTTSTNTLLSTDIHSELYYSTNYVPAASVCNVLGMRFESYDDEANGIRAARVSDASAVYSLQELVTMYSPVRRTDETKEDGGTDAPDGSAADENTSDDKVTDTHPSDPVVPEPPASDPPAGKPEPVVPVKPEPPADPYQSVAQRTVYVFADMANGASPEALLRLLEAKGTGAMFLISPTAYSQEEAAAIRSVSAYGHPAALTFDIKDADGNARSGEDIVAGLEEKNALLALYTKTKTRYVYAADGAVDEEVGQTLEAHGYALLPRVTFYASGTAPETIADDICGSRPKLAASVGIGIPVDEKTALEALFGLFEKYPAFRVRVPDEYMTLSA